MSRGNTIKPAQQQQSAVVETNPDVLRDLASDITSLASDLNGMLKELHDDKPPAWKFWKRHRQTHTDWRIQRLNNIADTITKTPCRGQMFMYIENVDASYVHCHEPRGHGGNHEAEVSVGTHAVKVQWSGPEED